MLTYTPRFPKYVEVILVSIQMYNVLYSHFNQKISNFRSICTIAVYIANYYLYSICSSSRSIIFARAPDRPAHVQRRSLGLEITAVGFAYGQKIAGLRAVDGLVQPSCQAGSHVP